MAHKLADETLQAILQAVLEVAEEDFADTSPESPFDRADASGTDGALLLVCKRWMRVATPLFYHCVVLRALPRAQALAKTLKVNPALGPLIKQLRIEGGLGASVENIMEAATNVRDLCILPDFRGRKTNIAAMCSALPQIQPRRLILCESLKKTKSLERLGTALVSAFSAWTRLNTLVISARTLPSVIDAVTLDRPDGAIEVHLTGDVPWSAYAPVRRLLELKSVSAVYIKSPDEYFGLAQHMKPEILGIDAPWEVLKNPQNRIKLKYTDDIPSSAVVWPRSRVVELFFA